MAQRQHDDHTLFSLPPGSSNSCIDLTADVAIASFLFFPFWEKLVDLLYWVIPKETGSEVPKLRLDEVGLKRDKNNSDL